VNKLDPAGNAWLDRTFDRVFGKGSFERTFGSDAVAWSDRAFGNEQDKQYANEWGSVSHEVQAVNSYSYGTYKEGRIFSSSGAAYSADGALYETAMVASGLGVGYRLALGAGSAAAAAVGLGTKAPQVVLQGGNHSVYLSYRLDGSVEYIGQTMNVAARTAAHSRVGRNITEVATQLSRSEARALEQVLINKYGLGTLSNKINSIAATNPIYQGAIQTGTTIGNLLGLL
jgi:hypothetical protein